ncbi:hypothetical protein KTR66_14125 [Roseococcus sp. SDR]|uniref:hypothetical protein n=1 Tax=Roseococcus sp. SDR TaxID=2835532 RepID=UPI001BCB1670|nr:hypothetical protein [Roseococcus sp. SDR]MBS7791136.1 hypothetical protein [Roseococcus sp. SDR]MBV1846450.1 hypothetical protein [Roseococcus sp. SDR]
MRAALALPLLLWPALAMADPRCARFGQPSYTATRVTSWGNAPPATAQVFQAGPNLRLETPAPGEARLVTLMTPGLNAVFTTNATPPVALRMPPPPAPPPGRERQEAQRAGILLIQEVQGVSGQWHEVARHLCRRDGVLLEARQLQQSPEGLITLETRQSGIRMISADPALFQVPAGFRLIEAPAQPISRRTAPPPG